MITLKNFVPVVLLGSCLVVVEMYFMRGDDPVEENKQNIDFEAIDYEPYYIADLKPFLLESVQYGVERVCAVKGIPVDVLTGNLPKRITLTCSHGPVSAEFVSFNGEDIDRPILNLKFDS